MGLSDLPFAQLLDAFGVISGAMDPVHLTWTFHWFDQFSCNSVRVLRLYYLLIKSVKYDHSLLLVCVWPSELHQITMFAINFCHGFCLKGAVCMIISEVPFFYFADPIVQRFGILFLGSCWIHSSRSVKLFFFSRIFKGSVVWTCMCEITQDIWIGQDNRVML